MNALRSTRSFLLAASLVAAPAIDAAGGTDLTPRFKEPRAGTTVDETFIVELPRSVDVPCVEIDAGNARIRVARGLLDALAKGPALGAGWKSEDERMAMIHGDRARRLLAAASAAPGDCAQRVGEQQLRGDIGFLVMTLLASANAAVIDAQGGRAVEKIRFEYKAQGRVGGFISIYLDRGTIFMVLDWWVS